MSGFFAFKFLLSAIGSSYGFLNIFIQIFIDYINISFYVFGCFVYMNLLKPHAVWCSRRY